MTDNQEDQIMQKFESEFGRGMLLSERFVMKETVSVLRQEQSSRPVVDVEALKIEVCEFVSSDNKVSHAAHPYSWIKAAIDFLQSRGHLAQGWREIESAEKNGVPVLLRFKDELEVDYQADPIWNNRVIVANHWGVSEDGFDIGWSFAAPVGMGGFPDKWIAGWMPINPPNEKEES